VVGGEQLSNDTYASIWSPKPSLQTNKSSVILGLGGTRAHLFAVGGDSVSAVYGQVHFDASSAAHLGILHPLNPPGTGTWKGLKATAVATDALGKMVAIGDGTPSARNSHAEALIWHGTRSELLQSALPSRSGWTLSTAGAMNIPGQILGTGVVSGKQSTYLMTPVK
jgi:hypothetical protein